MTQVQVFDPPMCCSTGVCGPTVDPQLPRFAADLDWLRSQGVAVERFNLAQQPAAFVGNPVVKQALAEQGRACLPLIVVDERLGSRGAYPTREELAHLAGLTQAATPRARDAGAGLRIVEGASCCAPGGRGSTCC